MEKKTTDCPPGYRRELRAFLKSSAHLGDDLSQARVAHHQPAAGGDAVRLVLELLRLHFVEVLEAAGQT